MTTKQERSDKYYIGPATSQKVVYYLGLSAQEVTILRHLLERSLNIGTLTTEEAHITRSIYQKANENLQFSGEKLRDSSLPLQSSELRHKLQECRKKLNELEDELEVGEMLV